MTGGSRLRVLIAGHLPPPLGGIATYCESLMGSSLAERLDLAFVQTSTHQRDLSQAGSASYSNIVAAFKDCVRFFKATLSHRPQVCHLNTAYGSSFVKHSLCLGVARLFGSQVLLHLHCSLNALYEGKPGWWRWYFRQVIRLTGGVIALSSEWKQLAQIVPGSQVYFLQNAIDLALYQAIAQARLPQANPLRILYLGYIWKAKGSFDLVEAARRMVAGGVQAAFDLVGSEMRPGELEQLHTLIQEAGLSGVVNLHPPAFGVDKLAFFRSADIFVYPSYSEGMPMAVIEAMASGLPIVASRAGGLPDLVSDGVNGLLVEPGKPDQLAGALNRLISDPDLRKSMREQSARLASEQFDIEQHVERLVEIYARCVPAA
jgi:glycosyltransferase involved in cell wall biosynthesis